MRNYVVCFDNGYDNKFIEVEATSENDAIKKAKENFKLNYSESLSSYIIDAEEV